jgi:hypothetical protein
VGDAPGVPPAVGAADAAARFVGAGELGTGVTPQATRTTASALASHARPRGPPVVTVRI